MEKHGHLRLSADVRARLLRISPATVDRMLSPERERIRQGVSTTRAGNLLGGVEDNETILDAALRELREEAICDYH